MTDNKIIKAYSERCDKLTDVNLYLAKLCDEKDDLINRLKAENERLENERFCLANERDAMADCLNEAVEEAKSEARKEFAKELLMKFHPLRRFSKVTLRYRIVCLLKKKQALENKTNIYTAAPNSPKEKTT